MRRSRPSRIQLHKMTGKILRHEEHKGREKKKVRRSSIGGVTKLNSVDSFSVPSLCSSCLGGEYLRFHHVGRSHHDPSASVRRFNFFGSGAGSSWATSQLCELGFGRGKPCKLSGRHPDRLHALFLLMAMCVHDMATGTSRLSSFRGNSAPQGIWPGWAGPSAFFGYHNTPSIQSPMAKRRSWQGWMSNECSPSVIGCSTFAACGRFWDRP